MRDACSGCEGVDGGLRARYLRCFAPFYVNVLA